MSKRRESRPPGQDRAALYQNLATYDNAQGSRSCPDCTARGAAELCHDLSCPTGRGIDALVDRDLQWLDQHPFASYRWRPAEPVEVDEVRMSGAPVTGRLRVHVRRHPLGLLRRVFTDRRQLLITVLSEVGR